MKAPIQMDFAKNPQNKVWSVNSDPAALDDMYNRLLGPGGSRMLPDELKWLAVTHKSFDQGRRGFNDRLALLGMSELFPSGYISFWIGWLTGTGRMTLVMETTKSIVSKAPMEGTKIEDEFSDRRTAFQHDQLLPVDNLIIEGPKDVAAKEKIHALAQSVGMNNVLRWKPRLVSLKSKFTLILHPTN